MSPSMSLPMLPPMPWLPLTCAARMSSSILVTSGKSAEFASDEVFDCSAFAMQLADARSPMRAPPTAAASLAARSSRLHSDKHVYTAGAQQGLNI